MCMRVCMCVHFHTHIATVSRSAICTCTVYSHKHTVLHDPMLHTYMCSVQLVYYKTMYRNEGVPEKLISELVEETAANKEVPHV